MAGATRAAGRAEERRLGFVHRFMQHLAPAQPRRGAFRQSFRMSEIFFSGARKKLRASLHPTGISCVSSCDMHRLARYVIFIIRHFSLCICRPPF
jgi:hypothetical protein